MHKARTTDDVSHLRWQKGHEGLAKYFGSDRFRQHGVQTIAQRILKADKIT